jgi:hypothetical protein
MSHTTQQQQHTTPLIFFVIALRVVCSVRSARTWLVAGATRAEVSAEKGEEQLKSSSGPVPAVRRKIESKQQK